MELAVILMALICVSLAAYWDLRLSPYPDEFLIVQPSMVRLFGQEPGPSVYPPGSILFFEGWLRFLDLFRSLETINPIRVMLLARVANIFIYFINILLFFLLARNFVKNGYALLSTLIFALNLGVFFSGTLTKSDGFNLLWVLVGLLIFDEIAKKGDNIILHALSGVICSMAVCAKYNAIMIIAYVMANIVPWDRKSEKFLSYINKPRILNIIIFSVSFLSVLVFLWPDFLHIGEKFGHFQRDMYLINDPMIFKAINEWNAFPYGRYSYPLLILLLWMAPVAYPSAVAALMARVLPRRLLLVQGIFSLGFFAFLASVTLHHPPYNFIPVMPFMVIAATMLWQKLILCSNKLFKLSGFFLIFLAIFISFVQFSTIPSFISQVKIMFFGMNEKIKKAEENGNKVAHFMYSNNIAGISFDIANVEREISNRKPDIIFILDSYYFHLLKFKDHSNRSLGLYLKNLMENSKEYEIHRQFQFHFPLQWLFLDTERSLTFYSLERRPETKSRCTPENPPLASDQGPP